MSIGALRLPDTLKIGGLAASWKPDLQVSDRINGRAGQLVGEPARGIDRPAPVGAPRAGSVSSHDEPTKKRPGPTMSRTITRRTMLRLGALTGAAAVLSAC